MSFVFISYSREDVRVATKLVALLENENMDVFQDKRIRFGEDHKKIIVDRLGSAGCVLVLWSRHSVYSHWVNYEAEAGLGRDNLLESRLDDTKPPPPFGVLNTADLSGWTGNAANAEVRRLLESVSSRLRPARGSDHAFTLAAPLRTEEITDSHVTLIHTSWRTKQNDKRFGGAPTYRWDIAMYGSTEALNRIEQVTYFLDPAYEQPQNDPPSFAVSTLKAKVHRKDCFRLSQIANGTSLVRAHVRVKQQGEVIKLSRYVNLFDAKDRIADYRL